MLQPDASIPDGQIPLPAALAQLRERLREFSVERRGDSGRVSTGCAGLDHHLPEQGLCRGTLVEWLEASPGGGAGSLALAAAREACRDGAPLVLIDREARFYPPAAARAGLDLNRLIIVRPENSNDERWALDQSLRSAGVAAVLCWLPQAPTRAWRRWQLAAESSGNLGLFVRPATARGDPSWADVRFLVQPQSISQQLASRQLTQGARRLRVELLRLRGESAGQTIDLELDDETGVVRLAPPLAPAALGRDASRA